MRTDGGSQGVGSTEHGTTSLDGIKTFEDNGYDGAGGHVLDQAREEGLVGKISVVYVGHVRVLDTMTNRDQRSYLRFRRCSSVGWTNLRATILNPRSSKRAMILPTSPRWTPSGYKRDDKKQEN